MTPFLKEIEKIGIAAGSPDFKFKPSFIYRLAVRASKEERDEVSKFFSLVSSQGMSIKDLVVNGTFSTEFPILSGSDVFIDSMGDIIDSIMSPDSDFDLSNIM